MDNHRGHYTRQERREDQHKALFLKDIAIIKTTIQSDDDAFPLGIPNVLQPHLSPK